MRAKPVTKTKVKEEGKSQTAGKGIAHGGLALLLGTCPLP